MLFFVAQWVCGGYCVVNRCVLLFCDSFCRDVLGALSTNFTRSRKRDMNSIPKLAVALLALFSASTCLMGTTDADHKEVPSHIAAGLYGGSGTCDLILENKVWCGYTCPLPGVGSCDFWNPCGTHSLVVKMGSGTKQTYSTKHCGDSWWCVSYPDYMVNCGT